HLHDTIIPLNNPCPKPGQPDTNGIPQQIVYPATYPDLELARRPKEMKVVLQEWQSVWDVLMEQHKGKPETDSEDNDWCCMYCILSLQDDFINEKPLIHHYIESCRHICHVLPKFHCELNPIEML
ncbi:hypothetical protein BDR03DRAFT_839069, partial [Suillus americanus]